DLGLDLAARRTHCERLSLGSRSRYSFHDAGPYRPRSPPMRRRQFITLLVGAAAAWPLAARAQQDGRVRRVGWLIGGTEGDARPRASVAALRGGLAKLGWIEGRNLHVELRFGAGDLGRMRTGAADLVSSSEVIVTSQTAA